MTATLLVVAGFASGSLVFSYWLGRLRGRDIRSLGDGNPGAANVFRAAGPAFGIAALLLDFLKGAIPVALAFWLLHIRGWALAPVAVAPVAGHAFSPFLGFRGGKAVTVTFGIWSGLTLWEAPCLLGAVFLFGRFVLRLGDAWVVMTGMAALLGYVAWRHPAPEWFALWAGNAAVLAIKHRRELKGS